MTVADDETGMVFGLGHDDLYRGDLRRRRTVLLQAGQERIDRGVATLDMNFNTVAAIQDPAA